MKYIVLCFSLLIVGLDQFFKKLAVENLSNIETMPLIDGFFHLSYVENRGAAFGILDEKAMLLSVFTIVILLAVIGFIVTGKMKNKFLLWAMALVLGGGIGNLIDRLSKGYVVDYLDLRVINFAVFNFADCCVVIGAILIILYMFFVDGKNANTDTPLQYDEYGIQTTSNDEANQEEKSDENE